MLVFLTKNIRFVIEQHGVSHKSIFGLSNVTIPDQYCFKY